MHFCPPFLCQTVYWNHIWSLRSPVSKLLWQFSALWHPMNWTNNYYYNYWCKSSKKYNSEYNQTLSYHIMQIFRDLRKTKRILNTKRNSCTAVTVSWEWTSNTDDNNVRKIEEVKYTNLMGFNMNLYLLCIFLVYLKQEIDIIIVPPGIKSDHLVIFLNMYQNLHAGLSKFGEDQQTGTNSLTITA